MNDMKLQMIVTGDNSGLNAMLNQSDANVRSFTTKAASHFSALQAHATKVWGAISGASAATKMIGVGIGMGSLKSVIDDNLEFEKTMMRLQFNAQMTTKEVAELREEAMKLSKVSLNSPLEVAQLAFRLANDNLKVESIKKMMPVIAKAAPVFEAPAEDIGNMSVDIMQKMGIKEEQMSRMLNMLYYHGTHGRFLTKDMALQAPEYLNAGKFVGITGEKGLNFMGAVTQQMMRNATVHNPTEVSTFIEHGLSHITQPHYVKGLKKFGINVMDYFNKDGKTFKGEGGVDGIIGLTKAMKAHGLDNPFKLGQAGFREHYSQVYWRGMMESINADDSDEHPNLIKQMERGQQAANEDQLGVNLAAIKEANFGKIKAAEIEIDKAKLSSGAQKLTEMTGSFANAFSEHPVATAAATTAAVLGAKEIGSLLVRKLLGGGGAGGKLEKMLGGAGGAGMPVTVTNWPGGLGGLGGLGDLPIPGFGGPEKASARMARLARLGAAAGGAAEAAEGVTAGEVLAGGAEVVGAAGAATLVAGTAGIAALDVGMGAALLATDGDGTDPLNHPGQRFKRMRGVKDGGVWEDDATLPQEHKGMHFQRFGRGGAWVKNEEPKASDEESSGVPSWLKSLFGGNSIETNTGRSRPGVAKGAATPAPAATAAPAAPDAAAKAKAASEAAALAAQQARWKAQLGQIDQNIGKASAKHDTEMLTKLEKQRTDLVSKLDEVIRAVAALNNRPVQVTLDGKPIIAAVNTANGRDARRN
jgi:hypothetical protein